MNGILDKAASPCRNICQLSDDEGICTGCGRTLDEIAQWISLPADERKQVNEAAVQRLARLETR